MRVAVIGSGIAGLSAAYDLHEAGFEVVVLERDVRAGGRMAETRLGSLHVNTGATILFSFYDAMFDLVRALGLSDQVCATPHLETGLATHGELEYDVGRGGIGSLLRHPALGLRSKLRLPTLLPDIWRAGRRTDPNLAHTAAYLDDESLSEYLRRRVGEDFLENYVEPVFRSVWCWEPEVISKAYFLPTFAHTVRHRACAFRDGIGLLTRTLAARLDVRLQTSVESVRAAPGGERCTLRYRDPSGAGEMTADLVVCAVPGSRVLGLVEDLAPAERSFFESVRYTTCCEIHYVLKSPPPAWGRVYTRRHPSPFSSYEQIPGDRDRPGDPPRLFCCLSPQSVEAYRAASPSEEVSEWIRPAVRQLYPRLDEELSEVHTQWWDDMLPEFYPGFIRGLASFLQSLERRPPRSRRIYFCGDSLSHAHTGGACASGRRTARSVLEHWRA
ncbi:MAG: protoporphyrinogen/coproporphyrinogen oxidase [Myxococcota bacterium]